MLTIFGYWVEMKWLRISYNGLLIESGRLGMGLLCWMNDRLLWNMLLLLLWTSVSSFQLEGVSGSTDLPFSWRGRRWLGLDFLLDDRPEIGLVRDFYW